MNKINLRKKKKRTEPKHFYCSGAIKTLFCLFKHLTSHNIAMVAQPMA